MIRAFIFSILIATFGLGQASAEESPLMVVRFNQDYVSYDRQLEKAVNMAVNTKDSVFFDVVSIIPETNDNKQNKLLKKTAEYRADQMVENIQGAGIAPEKIRLTYQNSKLAKNNEVHIFVR